MTANLALIAKTRMTLQHKVRRVELEYIMEILLVVEIYNALSKSWKIQGAQNYEFNLESCFKSVCGLGLVHLEQAAF